MTDSFRRQFLLRAITSCSAGALMLSTYGCNLFDQSISSITGQTTMLPKIPPSLNTVQLEVVFIERPKGDPLLGKALWKEIDQIGALDPDVRDILRKNGFKVGVTASDPPSALQSMIKQAMKKSDTQEQNQPIASSSRKITLLEGTSSDLQTSDFFSTCQVDIQEEIRIS